MSAIAALLYRRTKQFTRRGRCNGVVSRETSMRPRSRCNALFSDLLLLCFSVGHQSEFSDVRPLMGMKINSYHPAAVVDQRGRLLALIGRRSDPLSGIGIFH